MNQLYQYTAALVLDHNLFQKSIQKWIFLMTETLRHTYTYIYERSPTTKIEVELVNQEKRWIEFTGYIT